MNNETISNLLLLIIVCIIIWIVFNSNSKKNNKRDNFMTNFMKEEIPVPPPNRISNSLELFDNITMENNNYNTNNCNIINSNIIKDYKNKYYPIYKHQINCNKNSNTNHSDCNQTMDANSINRYTLVMNNNKSCSTCINDKKNYKKHLYNQLPDEIKNIDNELYNKKKITNNNVSNFVNFENNVYQNSIGETSVDKMAEIRTNIGTCGLKDYGTTIADIYDNLLSTTSGKKLESEMPNPDKITGILEDASKASFYSDIYKPV